MAEDRPAEPPGRDLPAPYENPWHLLGRDIRALLATGRLRVWELSRRNREGDLPIPRFWPRALGAWFWPLLLILALAVPPGLVRLARPGGPPASPLQADGPAPRSAVTPEPLPAPALPAETPPGESLALEADEPQTPTAVPPVPEPVVVVDPLLPLLRPADPRLLIQAARDRPARSCLELELAPSFATLPEDVRRRQAEDWRALALELGYERLVLVDGSGRLLGRTARVGSGMILLTASAEEDAR